jgi:hypothetical protein
MYIAAVGYSKALSRQFLEMAEEIHEKLHPGQSVFLPRFEPASSEYKSEVLPLEETCSVM